MTDDRDELQRLAYGRGIADDARDAAARRLHELDAEALRAAALSFEVRAAEPGPAPRRWSPLGVAAFAVLGAAAIAGLAVAASTVLAPVPVAQSSPPPVRVDVEPIPLSSNPFRTSVPLPEGASLVQPDVDVQIPDWVAGSIDAPVSVVGLGEGNGYTVWGSLLIDGSACLNLTKGDTSEGRCDAFVVFQQDGLTMDRGSWSVHWNPDGTLVWEGLP